MSGAAYFCSKSAYLCGSGLVRIVTPECNRSVLQILLPEGVVEACHESMDKKRMLALIAWADVILIGPGLGTGQLSAEMTSCVMEHATVPIVCDADALNILSDHMEWLDKCRGDVVVTPHFGEMSRLCRCGIDAIRDHKVETAETFAREHSLICVLKDAATITAFPEGMTYLNDSGNPGMATAGSGDVLSGILAGLLAQGMDPREAVPLGVYVHGLAGDAAAAKKGILGMTATDLMDALTEILQERGQ